ncbi:MAG: cysteine synthase A [Bacillota bacterium]
MIYNNVVELVGNTPMVKLNKLAPDKNIYAKLESYNPAGSVKDRIAWKMVEMAEKNGDLKPGFTIVEPTSGNTGIGLGMVAAVKDYDIILVMPESMSEERRKLLKSYGAELVLTPAEEGMKGAVKKAEAIIEDNEDYFMPSQFDNPANPQAHRETTAREIIDDLDRVDYLVVGVGTGGTITGTGEVLKEEFPEVKICAVEPANSPVISGGTPGPHKIQGIGAGFIPEVLNEELIDEIITVENEDAFAISKRLAQEEGLLTGISSGANVAAALQVAENISSEENIVTVLPDTGERYLSIY